MEDFLKVHPVAINKFYLFYFITSVIFVSTFIISTVIYCLSQYSLDYMEEIDPDIDISGLDSFNFTSTSFLLDYYPEMSNLGTTGIIYLDCYMGDCYVSTGSRSCEDAHGNPRSCTVKDYLTEHACSDTCRLTGEKNCKGSCISTNDSRCAFIQNDEDYYKEKSCNAYNLILFWKDLYYMRENISTYKYYTYLNNAVPENETCPEGKKMCGILDHLGNKLCYPENEKCPINFISTDSYYENDNNTNRAYINNLTIYYSNNETETGRIVGGLFVDTDILINYNDEECEILDTDNISTFLKNNQRLYKNSLLFDPYKDKKIDTRGKSYLKWCGPEPGKEKNLSVLKEMKKVYDYNMTTNENLLKPLKIKIIISYFVSLGGFILFFVFLLLFLFSFYYQNDFGIVFKFECFKCCYSKYRINIFLVILFFISFIPLIIGTIFGSINYSNLFSARKLDLGSNVVIKLIVLTIIVTVLKAILLIFGSFFLIYIYINNYDHYEKMYT